MPVNWYSFPTKICFGVDALAELPKTVAAQKLGKALIVTDAGFAGTRAYENVKATLDRAGIPFSAYAEVKGNPTEEDVNEGLARFNENNCKWILGVGGGSPLDVAKAIRLMATHEGDIFDYDDAKGGDSKITPNVAPFIAIPTTAGTGSEVGRSTVIVNTKTRVKTIIFSPYLMADFVFADARLTVDLPAKITAATGMDALTHNIESYLAKGTHLIADSIALGGIRLCVKSLKKAVEYPNDLEARGNMLMASMMGAIAFQKGLGVTHSLAHPLSTIAGLHHGLANGIMLATALRFNSDVAGARLTDISRVIIDALGRNDLPSAENGIRYVETLCGDIGLPRRLSDAGVNSGHLAALVEQAVTDTCWHSNPKPVTKHDFEKLYREIM